MNKEKEFYKRLTEEYDCYMEEIRDWDADDIIENSEFIADYRNIYAYIINDNPIHSQEQIEHFSKLKNPLKFMCEEYQHNKAPIYDSFNQTLWKIEQEKKLDWITNEYSEKVKILMLNEYERDGVYYGEQSRIYAAENLINEVMDKDFCFDEYDTKIFMQFKKPFSVLLDNYTDSRITGLKDQYEKIIEKLNGMDLLTSIYPMHKDNILPETLHRHNIINYIVEHVPEPDFESTKRWLDFFRELQINSAEDLDLKNNPYEAFQTSLETIENSYGAEILQKVYDMAKNYNLILENELIGAAKYIADGGDVANVRKLADNGYFGLSQEENSVSADEFLEERESGMNMI